MAQTYAAKHADPKIKNVLLQAVQINTRQSGGVIAVTTRLRTTHEADVSRRTGVTSPIKTVREKKPTKGGQFDEGFSIWGSLHSHNYLT